MNTLTPLCVVITLCGMAFVFVREFIKNRFDRYQSIRSATFVELLSILNTIIKIELEQYERNIFESKGAITNANFDSFYNDLNLRILNQISPPFFSQLEMYITKEEIIRFVARSVKEYLAQKITGTL